MQLVHMKVSQTFHGTAECLTDTVNVTLTFLSVLEIFCYTLHQCLSDIM